MLWVWPPDPATDRPWRKFQHLYYIAAFAFLHVVWRVDSAVVVYKRKLWVEASINPPALKPFSCCPSQGSPFNRTSTRALPVLLPWLSLSQPAPHFRTAPLANCSF